LGRDGGGEDAPSTQVGVVIGDKRVVGIVAGGPGGKGRAQLAGYRDPVGPRRAIGRNGFAGCHRASSGCQDGNLSGSRQDQKMDLSCPGRLTTVKIMKGYGQFCPVAVASEIFAERWTPLILRELFSGSRRFNEIRSGMPLISRTLLAQRLRHLEDA